MSFSFRFERLLRLCRDIEDRRRHQIARVRMRLEEARLLEVEAVGRHLSSREELRRVQSRSALPLEELIAHQGFVQWLRERAEKAAEVRRQWELELAKAHAAYEEAARERKKLDKLRERAWAGFRLESERREQREQDEIAISAVRRRVSG